MLNKESTMASLAALCDVQSVLELDIPSDLSDVV